MRSTCGRCWRSLKKRHDKLADFRFRTFLVATVPSTKPNQVRTVAGPQLHVSYAQLRPQDRQLRSPAIGDQLLTRLMPEGLRVVPAPIGVILIVYVLPIGPGDCCAGRSNAEMDLGHVSSSRCADIADGLAR